jgi:LPS-assembly protein
LFFLFTAGLLAAASLLPGQTINRPAKADLPPEDEIWYGAVLQDSHEEWKYLKGGAKVQTTEMSISADEIDFNSDTNWAYARGHVRLEHFVSGDVLNADHGEYNLKTEEGKFYAVSGTSPAKIMTSPGILTTTNPFYFEALWADRIKNRYVLHKGFVTDCKLPKPWWTFNAPLFDIVPGERAIARHTVFRLKHVPVLYLPYFYRPLGKNTRRSGFLTPNIGRSTIRGYMIGGGYYWAINRSYDMDYGLQYFTRRGPAHTFDFRGKPNEVTDFNFNFYAVQDKGLPQPGGGVQKQGGEQFELTARTQIWGFTGRLDYNYLSSYLFRTAFSNSYIGAISSEVDSIGFLQRHFNHDLYTLNLVAQRSQIFESVTLPGQRPNQVVIQKLPSVEFSARDQEIAKGPVPVWVSLAASGGLVSRQEPGFQTGWATPRIDLAPRVATAFSFKGFSLYPSLTFEATDYGKSYAVNNTTYSAVESCGGYPSCSPTAASNVVVASENILRKDTDFVLDFRLPPLERIYVPPTWLHLGAKVKHVVEADAEYEYVTGVNEFQRIIHFDSTDIISNTNQLTVSLTNRLYKKTKNGDVSEFLTWRVTQARYFDPTFGGTAVAGQRTVNYAAAALTPYAFLDGPRGYSPVISSLTVNPYAFLGVEYRAAYDPRKNKFVDHTITGSVRVSKYFASIGDTAITTNPLLVPQANQLSFSAGYGNTNRKGWNVAATVTRDLLLRRTLYQFVQASYNTDCCGFSLQWRRFNIGIRDETQYLFSFSVANLGTFGSLQKQERIF